MGSKKEQPPLGLCYLAAMMRAKKHSVDIIDAEFEDLRISEVVSRIKASKSDIVGFTCVTATYDVTVEIAKGVKGYDSDILTLIGGPHISAEPETTLSTGFFDIGIIGEGEQTVVELLDAIEKDIPLERVDGIIYRGPNSIVKTRPRKPIEDLDQLPYPARDLLPDIRLYKPSSKNYKRLPTTTMVTSRGCPFGCKFCDQSVFGRRYRQNTAEHVVNEIKILVKEFGIREIFFTEDTFTVDKERVEKICNLILEENIDIAWRCCTRVNLVTKDLLKKMKKSGMWHVYYGLESGNQDILDLLGKGITLKQIRDAIRWSDELGIYTQGAFMINHPTETHETIRETIDFAKSLRLTELSVLMLAPMPNTEFRNMCGSYGSFDNSDFTKMNPWQPIFVPKGLTKEYLEKKRKDFYREFYFRPQALCRILRHINTLSDFKRVLDRVKTIKTIFT
ncbi:MAG: B12-binding domain-containing radical SAM protein [Candidatus Altiarchaeota archaeon]|nr:B12-binding domain-containing radical SAM protein [Candidatus Altiarchaeota archaeon]